jgi:glycosyltransferase involved in cell wall biosynthesis
MNRPAISVVMGTYNAGKVLRESCMSLLKGHEAVPLEVIVVDDGSTDDSAELLAALAQDDVRLRVLMQPNQGLTAALVAGCKLARGRYIARQDAGDVSLPGRLVKQMARLAHEPDAVMCSSFAEFRGPRDELLYTSAVDEAALQCDADGMARGPSHHGTVMMHRDAYEAVGGYRRAFYFAQDVDLWSRLTERGCHVVVPEVLYRARLEPGALSGRYAREQRRLARLIRQAAAARRAGRDESALLAAAAKIRPRRRGGTRRGYAKGAYFIGSCLQGRDPAAARRYLLEAVANNPMHLRAWARLAQLSVRSY